MRSSKSKTSDHMPLEMQIEIMKRLPIKSIVRFRSVSKELKAFIDSPEFIKKHNINHPNPEHRLFVKSNLRYVRKYTSIIDDDSFPKQRFPITAPYIFKHMRQPSTIGPVYGLLCSYEVGQLGGNLAVIWNPSVRKYVYTDIPDVLRLPDGHTFLGFGVCSHTFDPKLVRINVGKTPSIWDVQMFTLSSRVWRTVYTGAPFNPSGLMWNQVCIDGSIYWGGGRGSFITAFDLKTEKFYKVGLPESTYDLLVEKVNESLALLEYNRGCEMLLCGVWMRKDGVNQPFTKIYTIRVEGKPVTPTSVFWTVLGFRNNGEVLMQIGDDGSGKSQIGVYDHSSGRIDGVGIVGDYISFSTSSYVETLLLLDDGFSYVALDE